MPAATTSPCCCSARIRSAADEDGPAPCDTPVQGLAASGAELEWLALGQLLVHPMHFGVTHVQVRIAKSARR